MSPIPFFIARRKLKNERSVHKLVFNAANEDYIDLGTGYAWIHRFEGHATISIGDWSEGSPLIGQHGVLNSPSGYWGLYTGFPISGDPVLLHLGNNGIVTSNKLPWRDAVIYCQGILNVWKIFVDFISTRTDTAFNTDPIDPDIRMLVAGGVASDGVTVVEFATGTVHWFNVNRPSAIDGDITFYLNEGSGNIVTSDTGVTGIIKTSHPNGQAYIDDVMWRKDDGSLLTIEVTVFPGDLQVILPFEFANVNSGTLYDGEGGSSFYNNSSGIGVTFNAAGTYRVEFDGTVTQFDAFNNWVGFFSPYLTKVISFGTIAMTVLNFNNCEELTEITAEVLPSTVVSLAHFIASCDKIHSIKYVANWDISNVTDLTDFAQSNYLVTSNYDDLLVGWTGWIDGIPTKGFQLGLTFDVGTSKYTLGSEAEDARDYLINVAGWIINDGGGI